MTQPEIITPQVNVDHAFDPVARKAQEDFDLYLQNRPVLDQAGNLHDPATGNFINPSRYHDTQREIHFESTQQPKLEEMGMFELARELAEAEVNGNKTAVEDISPVLLDKMSAQAGKMSPDGHEDGKTAEDAIFDRVIRYKDKYKADLLGEKARTDSETDSSADSSLEQLQTLQKQAADAETDAYKSVINFVNSDETDPEKLREAALNALDDIQIARQSGNDALDATQRALLATLEGEEGATGNSENGHAAPALDSERPAPAVEDVVPEMDESISREFPEHTESVEEFNRDYYDNGEDESENSDYKSPVERIRDRLQSVWYGAAARFTGEANRDNGENNSKKRKALLIGAVAVAGIVGWKTGVIGDAVDSVKDLFDGSDNTDKGNSSGADKPENNNTASDKPNRDKAPTVGDIGILEEKGSNIWEDAEQNLISKGINGPSEAQIQAETQRILDLNNLSWEEARDLPVGYKFQV